MEDIDKVLAYEIKKDIAERYFGSRKNLEQETSAYLANILQTTLELEAGIGIDIVRLYILLKNETVIKDFQHLVGFEPDLFYDPYICLSPTIRARVFGSERAHGMTRKSRFKNLFFAIYKRLHAETLAFRETRNQLADEQKSISEQISRFSRTHDLTTILAFIRELDRSEHDALSATKADNTFRQSLDEKMHIAEPQPVEKLLPAIPVVPPPEDISKALRPLINSGFEANNHIDVRLFCKGGDC